MKLNTGDVRPRPTTCDSGLVPCVALKVIMEDGGQVSRAYTRSRFFLTL